MNDIEKVIKDLESIKELGTDGSPAHIKIDNAIQTIKELSEGEVIVDGVVDYCDMNKQCRYVRELKEQIPKWHFVADGDLPKEQNDILLLLRSGEISTGMLAYTDGYFYADCISTKYVDIENVIAWTELPKFESEE